MFAFLFIGWAIATIWFFWHTFQYFKFGIIRWFEMNCGWFFVNGRKQRAWAEYVRKKYGEQ